MLIQPSPTHSAKSVEESIPLRDLEPDNDYPNKGHILKSSHYQYLKQRW